MILVMVRVMALSLWRDRAGLVLVFVLPPLVFIVFATVFSAGASGRLDIRVGVVDQIGSADSQQLVYSLQRRLGGRLTRSPNVAALEDAIESGRVDAGLVLHGDLADAPTPVTVLIHPGRKAAGEILIAQVNAAGGEDLPELMLRREVVRLGPLLSVDTRSGPPFGRNAARTSLDATVCGAAGPAWRRPAGDLLRGRSQHSVPDVHRHAGSDEPYRRAPSGAVAAPGS